MEQELPMIFDEMAKPEPLLAAVDHEGPPALAHDNVLGFAILMNLLFAAAESP